MEIDESPDRHGSMRSLKDRFQLDGWLLAERNKLINRHAELLLEMQQLLSELKRENAQLRTVIRETAASLGQLDAVKESTS